MIRINLLPVREERRKAGLRNLAFVMVAALVGSVAIAAAFHWKTTSDLEKAQRTMTATQQEIERFGPQVEQVEAYRSTKAEIEKKLEVIEQLGDARSGPVHVLDELATHMPDRVWITKIEVSQRKIRVHGMSLDNELVALFLTSLEDSPYFKLVELQKTKAKEKQGFKLNEFEVHATITSPLLERRELEKKQQQAAAGGRAPAGTGR